MAEEGGGVVGLRTDCEQLPKMPQEKRARGWVFSLGWGFWLLLRFMKASCRRRSRKTATTGRERSQGARRQARKAMEESLYRLYIIMKWWWCVLNRASLTGHRGVVWDIDAVTPTVLELKVWGEWGRGDDVAIGGWPVQQAPGFDVRGVPLIRKRSSRFGHVRCAACQLGLAGLVMGLLKGD